ncbi:MAG: HAMP domain-containing methyl-accepting chemotaxis protein [Euryarchaeota archaeon]|nr:HAMP domain-containing methyl-accepting chemotaxis protein [Euryarchaeota archaeon]
MRFGLTAKLVAVIMCMSLIPIAFISLVSIQGMYNIQKDATVLHDESIVVVAVIAGAGNDLASSHESFMTYVLDYGEAGSSIFYNSMVNYQSSFMQFLRDYKNRYSLAISPNMGDIITSQGQTALITEETRAYGVVVAEWESYTEETTSTISLLRAGDTASAYNAARNASLHMETINLNMEDLINVNDDAAALMDSVIHKTVNNAILYTVVGAAAATVAVILLSFVFSSMETKPIVAVSKTAKTIAEGNFRTRLEIKATNDEVGDLVKSMNMLIDNTSKPLIELTESAQAIAGGDMTREINVVAKGDLATLVEAFKQMRQNLSKLTNEIKIAAGSLKDSSASFAETIGHMTENTQQVSSAVAQESKSAQAESMRIDEMVRMLSEQTKAIYDVVQSSQNAAGASANASEVAQNGSKSAQISLEKMNSMLRNVEDTAEAMKLLSKKSKEISQVVSIITDIAHQTNLLSLNAAIEAARAGEQGRGFAVVADEVRKLAEGSRKAANQIQQLIELVENDIDDTTEKMEHTMKDASESSRTISDSLKSLEDIAATVEETAAMVQEISASTEEQKALTESLAKSLDEVAAISKENSASSEGISVSSENLAAGMEELTASAHELADLANKLNEITKQVESAKATVMTVQKAGEGK